MEVTAHTDALVSHAAASGLFDRVNTVEPKSAPGNGLTAAVWFQRVTPAPKASTLNTTAARVEMMLRIYLPMMREPQDDIDTRILEAVDVLLTAYSSDFTLDGMIKEVDLMGEHGTPLGAQSGYLDIDRTKMRVVDLTIPLIINDAWTQTP